ncbi:MAG: hypothetical protein IBJ10_10035 [Phycisphaerales bacterium]|nr:hypothetical protein [Phycisphaerales bacterium]
MIAPAYQNDQEVSAALALLMRADDPRRAAWDAAGDDDKAVARLQATIDIDAVRWRGSRACADQPMAWPRRERRGGALQFVGTFADAPGASVADLPRELRLAHAAQSAGIVLGAAAGQGAQAAAAEVEAAVAAGLTSQSVPGRSETYDARRAAAPFNRLEPEARRLLERFRWTGGSFS